MSFADIVGDLKALAPRLRGRLVANASAYAARNSWEVRKQDYLQLVDSLCPADLNGN